MRKLNKVFSILAFSFIFSMTAPSVLPHGNVTTVQAATEKLNHKSLTMNAGDTTTLKVNVTSKKITWSTSNKKIATVNKNGLVKAIKTGKATITATINKKKYQCTVTVIESNSYIKNAPFEAKEATFGKLKSVIPKDWDNTVISEKDNNLLAMIYPASADITKGTSNITVTITQTNIAQPEYSIVKKTLDKLLTQDFFLSQLSTYGIKGTISDYKVSDYKATLGTAYKAEYTLTFSDGSVNLNSDTEGTVKQGNYNGGSCKQAIYYLYLDNYMVALTVTESKDKVTPDVATVGEYLLNSFELIK